MATIFHIKATLIELSRLAPNPRKIGLTLFYYQKAIFRKTCIAHKPGTVSKYGKLERISGKALGNFI